VRGLESQPIGSRGDCSRGRLALVKPGLPATAFRRQGLDKGQRPGTRATMHSTARRGWISHFHPLVFQKRRFGALLY
jgi:hypothetical protein